MSYDVNKYTKLGSLKALGQRVETKINDLASRIGTVESNALVGVKVNGTALSIANKIVDILIATGSADGTVSVNNVDVAIKGLAALAFKSEVSESELSEALAATINGKAAASTVYTKEQIDGMIAAVYKPAGSVAFADLPALSASILGNVYNVTDKFTTTDSFVEGAGKKYPAGTNVVVVSPEEDVYKYDVLAGFVDLSGYAEKDTDAVQGNFAMFDANGNPVDSGKKASDFSKVEASSTEGKIKIDGTEVTLFTVATNEEVTEMLDEVFGAEDNE